jgi:soluble lytic murein transglycosylase-like protein
MQILKFALLIFTLSVLTETYTGNVIGIAEAKSSKRSAVKSPRKGSRKKSSKAGVGDVWARIRAGIRIPVPNPASGIETITVAAPPSSISGISIRASKTADTKETDRLTTVIPSDKSKEESSLTDKSRIRQILMPKKSSVSKQLPASNQYTELGRTKLASKENRNKLTEQLFKKHPDATDVKSDATFKSSVGRIRTRLGLHPELFKDGSKAGKNIDSTTASAKNSLPTNSTQSAQSQLAIRSCADLRKNEIINLAKKGYLASSYQQMAEQCRAKYGVINERIARQMGAFSRGFLSEAAERARPYLFHVVDTLSKHNLPLDLALLPIMESAYKPKALSSAKAAGVWQFIPSTGRTFGLEQTTDYDGRLNIVSSTQAAARFLAGLRDHYRGDWLLALAAYNWGPGNVDAAIAKNQAEGLDTDYWSLSMPAETQNYVPRLLALARIFSNPHGFGLNLRPLRNEPYFINVSIERDNDLDQLVHKDLTTLAKLASYDQDEFSFLNAGFLNSKITQKKPFNLLLPVANANQLHQSLAFMAQAYKDNRTYPYFIEAAFSSEANSMLPKQPMLTTALLDNAESAFKAKASATRHLLNSSKSTDATAQSNANNDYLTVHYLDKGESLKTLAEYHGLTEDILREINNLKRKQTPSFGQRLLIPLKEMALASIKRNNPSILFKGFNRAY